MSTAPSDRLPADARVAVDADALAADSAIDARPVVAVPVAARHWKAIGDMHDAPMRYQVYDTFSMLDVIWLAGQSVYHYLSLCARGNRKGECWPTLTQIATQCRMHRHTAVRALERLRATGMISKRKGSWGRPTVYTILSPDRWRRPEAAEAWRAPRSRASGQGT